MATGVFQSSVNFYPALFTPGDVVRSSPNKTIAYNLYSAAVPNNFGYAFTVTNGGNPNPALASPNAGTAQVGGTGVFAGILVNSKEYALYGTSGAPLNPTLALPDYTVAGLMTMGYVGVVVDNDPLVGDLVTYDPADGSISSIPPLVKFVGSSSTTTLTVASVSAGRLYVGMPVLSNTVGAVAPGTYITALGSGLGYTGTYTINNSQSIAGSTAMYAPNVPAPAFSGTATCSTTTMTVATVVSGEVYIGMAVNAASGFPSGTVVTGFGTGVGGTGTYTINTSQTVSPAVAITDTGNIVIPNATVSQYDITNPGYAIISLNN